MPPPERTEANTLPHTFLHKNLECAKIVCTFATDLHTQCPFTRKSADTPCKPQNPVSPMGGAWLHSHSNPIHRGDGILT